MQFALIGNPHAGRKAGLATNSTTVELAIAALAAVGVTPEVFLTEGPGHATVLAERVIAAGAETVIAAGGDGTVHEVAQAVVGSEATLGVMPLGSVMNIARTLGIGRDLDQAAEVIHAGRLLQMDVGEVNGKYFLEFAGVGIDAQVGPLAQQLDCGQWESFSALVRALWQYRPRRARLGVDGVWETVRTASIVVANTPYYGPAVELVPEAKVDDRQFDVKVLGRFSLTELALFGVQIARGARPYHPKIRHLRGRTIEVTARHPLAAHADFEPIGTTPVTFRLVPRALRVWANPALWETAESTAVSAAGKGSGSP
jgi:YegS/Rv2252/BmrU family lipid kinase